MQQKKIFLAVIFLLGLVVYSQTLHFEFLYWDDTTHISENPLLHSGSFFHFWKEPFFNLYIPVTYTIWVLIANLSRAFTGELSPSFFHGTNIVLHIFNAWLVFLIISQLINHHFKQDRHTTPQKRAHWVSGVGAFLFLLHPFQVESVAWVSSMRDILATLFALIAIYVLVSAKMRSGHLTKRPKPFEGLDAKRYALATLLFGLSLLSKPTMVVLPLIVFALFYFFYRIPFRKTWIFVLPWFLITLPLVSFTKHLQSDEIMNYVTPLYLRPLIALDAIGFYVMKFLWPLHLSPDYGRSPQVVLNSQGIWWFAALGFILLLGLWRYRQRSPLVIAGAAIALIGLLPVLGLVPFSYQGFSTVSDRYMYFPMVGIGMAASFALIPHFQKCWVIGVIVSTLLLLTAKTFLQIGHWRNNKSFYSFVIQQNPNSYMGQNGLAKVYTSEGQYESALAHSQKALQARPGNPVALNNIGHTLLEMKSYSQVIEYYSDVFTKHRPKGNNPPVFSLMHTNMAVALIHLRRYDEAHQHLDTAIELDAKNAVAWHNKGAIYLMHKQYEQSLPFLKKSVDLAPHLELHRKNYHLALSAIKDKK